MLYLSLAIACGAFYSILFKLFACREIDSLQAIAFNYLTAFALGVAVSLVSEGGAVPSGADVWLVAAVLGVMFMGAFVLMARSTARSGVTVTTVASRVSLIVPVVCSYLLLAEGDVPRWGAIAVIVVALVLLLIPDWRGGGSRVQQSGDKGGGASPMIWLYPLGVWLLFGLNNFGLKLAQSRLIAPNESAAFSAGIFLCAALFAALWWQLRGGDRRKFELRSALGGVALGVANFGVTWSLLHGLTRLPASLFFPIYHVAVVAVVALVGIVAFGERLGRWQTIGLLGAVVGIVMYFV